jgi:hypothetical protein
MRFISVRSQLLVVALATVTPLLLASDALAVEQAASARSASFLTAAMRVQPKRWEKAHNFDLLKKFATDATQKGAELVVTCEGFLDGYTGNAKLVPELTHAKYLQIGESLDEADCQAGV